MQTHCNDKERLDILNGKVGNNMGLSMTGRNDGLNTTPKSFAISPFGGLVGLRARHPTIIRSALPTNNNMHVNVHNPRYY